MNTEEYIKYEIEQGIQRSRITDLAVDLKESRIDLKRELKESRIDLKKELKESRTELRAELRESISDLKQDIRGLQHLVIGAILVPVLLFFLGFGITHFYNSHEITLSNQNKQTQ